MIRVLVVDDSVFVRKAMRRVLDGDPELAVVGEAEDGLKALELIPLLDPHVVALDIEMPGLDGYSTLRAIMEQFPRPVLMLSLHTREGAELTMRCLDGGAFDFLDKSAYSAMDYHLLAAELRTKVREAGAAQLRSGSMQLTTPQATLPTPVVTQRPWTLQALPRVVILGASTGGPPVLQQILAALPAEFPAPMIIVQHMPRGFTGSFARRLDGLSRLDVAEAESGELLRPGRVLIAPAGSHLRFGASAGDSRVELSPDPPDSAHIPSIDESMSSAASVFGAAGMGILLSGMGSDGARGLLEMSRAGSATVVQSVSSCVAPGMPRAALDRGAASQSLDPAGIIAMLCELKA